MTLRTITTLSVFLLTGSTLIGCAQEAPDQPTPGESVSREAKEEPASEPLRAQAVERFLRGGDFRFALADSQVDLEARCQAQLKEASTPGNDVDACKTRLTEAAAKEGVQITSLGDDRIRYVSYSHEDGKRVVLIDAETTVKAFEAGVVQLVDGKMIAGTMVDKQPPPGTRLLIEVVDENTIAMDKNPTADPRNGGMRLVFHRTER